MIAIGHTSVGVIVGTAAYQLLPDTISLPWQVIITGTAGIASHYLMDLMPHGHYNMNLSQPSRKQILKLVADVVKYFLICMRVDGGGGADHANLFMVLADYGMDGG